MSSTPHIWSISENTFPSITQPPSRIICIKLSSWISSGWTSWRSEPFLLEARSLKRRLYIVFYWELRFILSIFLFSRASLISKWCFYYRPLWLEIKDWLLAGDRLEPSRDLVRANEGCCNIIASSGQSVSSFSLKSNGRSSSNLSRSLVNS